MKGPQFLKNVIPILKILQANGGAGNSSSVIDQVVEDLGITEEDLAETTSNGQSRIRNQIQWARFYLFKAGLIDNSQRGIWRLTKGGLEAKYNETDVYKMFKSVQENEANRDGVTPIELIDGERLVELFEKYELGLKPVTVYEIDTEFFNSFT